MVSALDAAKRALVALLRALAVAYGCSANVTRDSIDGGDRHVRQTFGGGGDAAGAQQKILHS